MGHGKPGKSWNLNVSHGKSCKIEGYLVNFVIFPAVCKIHVSSHKKKNTANISAKIYNRVNIFLLKFTSD